MVHWLRDADVLPSIFPDSRIFTYDWPANTYHNAANDNLFGHAKMLLDKLQGHVRRTFHNKESEAKV